MVAKRKSGRPEIWIFIKCIFAIEAEDLLDRSQTNRKDVQSIISDDHIRQVIGFGLIK